MNDKKYTYIELLFKQMIAITTRLIKDRKINLRGLTLSSCQTTLSDNLTDTTIFVSKELIEDIERLIDDCHKECNLINSFNEDFKAYNGTEFKKTLLEKKLSKYAARYMVTFDSKRDYLRILLCCVSTSFPWGIGSKKFEEYDEIGNLFYTKLINIFNNVLISYT